MMINLKKQKAKYGYNGNYAITHKQKIEKNVYIVMGYNSISDEWATWHLMNKTYYWGIYGSKEFVQKNYLERIRKNYNLM